MNWAKHNLVQNGEVVSIAAWQQFDWLNQGFSLRNAGNVDYRFGDAAAARRLISGDSSWTTMRQVHGNHVEVVDDGSDFADTDGLVTNKVGVLLAVVVADCVPLLLVDPVQRIVGVAHAGRRGTEAGIAKVTVNQMVNCGSSKKDIQAAIGPSIGPCCYETDLWGTNEQQLREAGIQTIIRTDICTKDHKDLFFSHRADNQPGRFAGLVGVI